MNLTRLLYIPRAPDEIFQSVRKDDNDYLRKNEIAHLVPSACRSRCAVPCFSHTPSMDRVWMSLQVCSLRRARARLSKSVPNPSPPVSYQTVSPPVARLCLFPARSMHPFYLAMHCELCAPRAAITPPPLRFHFVGTRSAEKMSPHEKE